MFVCVYVSKIESCPIMMKFGILMFLGLLKPNLGNSWFIKFSSGGCKAAYLDRGCNQPIGRWGMKLLTLGWVKPTLQGSQCHFSRAGRACPMVAAKPPPTPRGQVGDPTKGLVSFLVILKHHFTMNTIHLGVSVWYLLENVKCLVKKSNEMIYLGK